MQRLVARFNDSEAAHHRAIGYRWEQYRQCWWILATVAGCIVVYSLLPLPRLFGPDDD